MPDTCAIISDYNDEKNIWIGQQKPMTLQEYKWLSFFLFMVNIAQERNVWKTSVNAIYRWAHEQKKKLVSQPLNSGSAGWDGATNVQFVFRSRHHCHCFCRSNSLTFLHLQRSKVSLSFMCKSSISLSTTSFHVFLGLPLCMAPSTSKVTHFSPNHNHPFLEHVHTITIYFFVPLELCLLFLTAVLIQCKIVYPLISHHTSI